MKPRIRDKHIGLAAAGAAFLAAYCFFQFAYPAHLMRREQQTLFLYDWHYIKETYRGFGWLSRLAGDFVDQFLYFPVIGPVLVALILTAIGAVVYRICRHGLGRWPSLGIAALILGWSFMRETENLFLTRYSLVTLGYLSLVLAAMQFRKGWIRAVAAVLFILAAIFPVGSPYNKYYGRLWGKPTMINEKMIALDVASARGRWDKVTKLSEEDLYVNEACYFYNIALARQGKLGNDFFNHSQNYANGLFLWVDSSVSQFTDSIAGEVWFQLGDMTLAEQSTIVGMQQSPKHNGARYLVRLAQITLITGEYGAAQKYLNMLSRTLNYRKWARSMMPENHSEKTVEWLAKARANLPEEDIIYGSNEVFRTILKNLLKANPDNMMARQYLLTFQLLMLDVEGFMESYREKPIPGDIYSQAVLIWLSAHRMMSESEAAKYGVGRQTIQRLEQFYRYPERYRNTYWYYFMDLTTE